VLALLVARGAAAQFSQYTGPGSLAASAVPTRERLEAAVAEARYRLGPMLWSPFFAIKDVTYVKGDTVLATNRRSDLTATAALGVHAYLTPRKTVYFAAHAVPEYAWWKNDRARTVTNWSTGVGVFVFSRPFTLEAAAIGARHQEYLSSAVEELVNVRRDEARGRVEAPLAGRLALFTSASSTAWRYRQEDVVGEAGQRLLALDRDETHLGGGLRWRWREGFALGVGWERVAVDFPRPDRDRSATGSGPVLELEWEGGAWRVAGRVARPALEPEAGSEFVPIEKAAGSAQLRWSPSGRTSLVAYGGRSLAFSFQDASPYYIDRRLGLALERRAGWRSTANLFVEGGEQRFVNRPGAAGRTEELATVGGSLMVQLRRALTLAAGASRTEYKARAGEEGRRTVTRVQLSLRSGNVRAQWW